MYCIWYMLTSTYSIYTYLYTSCFSHNTLPPWGLGGVGHNLLVQLPALLDEALLAIMGPESVFFPPRNRGSAVSVNLKKTSRNPVGKHGDFSLIDINFLGSVDPSFSSFVFRKRPSFCWRPSEKRWTTKKGIVPEGRQLQMTHECI